MSKEAVNTSVADVDSRNFETVVLRGSIEHPVIVQFWSARSEPCLALRGQLKEAALACDGAYTVAQVDIDQNMELAQAFGVQGVPAVFAVVEGKVADGFQGPLPPEELAKFLERVAPGGATKNPLVVARNRAESGDLDGAIADVRELVDDEEHGVPARALLAELLTESGDFEGAKLEFTALEAMDLPEEVAAAVARAKRALEAREDAGDLAELKANAKANPDDAAAQLDLGRALVSMREFEPGLEALLESVRIDPAHDGGAAKQAMLDAFETLGLEDPIANEYRFQLSLEILA